MDDAITTVYWTCTTNVDTTNVDTTMRQLLDTNTSHYPDVKLCAQTLVIRMDICVK